MSLPVVLTQDAEADFDSISLTRIGSRLSVCQIGTTTMITDHGFDPVLVETVINYKKPLRRSDQVHAEIWLSELSQAWRAHR
jgi:hypothetical protein